MYGPEQIEKNLKARGAHFEAHFDLEGGNGWLKYKSEVFNFVYSYGEGWEHVSVSTTKRCPTWEEMCFFKDLFWPGHEACIQYHPNKDNYVNNHKFCLHIWRPSDGKLPVPPSIFVGVK